MTSKHVRMKPIQHLKEPFPANPISTKHITNKISSLVSNQSKIEFNTTMTGSTERTIANSEKASKTSTTATAAAPPAASAYNQIKIVPTQVPKPSEKPRYPENICLEADLEEINHLIAQDLSDQNLNQDITTNLNQQTNTDLNQPPTNHLLQGTLTNCKWRAIQPDHMR